jgi:deoxyhypusine synthase
MALDVAGPAKPPATDPPTRDEATLHDGVQDGLEPVLPLDLSSITTVDTMLRSMRDTAFGARRLGEAADVLCEMTRAGCFVVGTFSGAMTVAKMGLVLCDMIDAGLVHCVVSTGALIAHGLIESVGGRHFKVPERSDDRDLYYRGYDRVYDTLELERNLDDLELITDCLLDAWPREQALTSSRLCHAIGEWLVANTPKPARGILKSAYQQRVPVFIPAFSDSELALNVALYNRRVRAGDPGLAHERGPVRTDEFQDLDAYTELVAAHGQLGIFVVGGGVPRNWAQQIGPYTDIIQKRGVMLGGDRPPKSLDLPFKRFRYGVRICPEPEQWGGLSGCSFREGVSWGKFIPAVDGGRYAEVPIDATIGWPLIVKAALERLARPQP